MVYADYDFYRNEYYGDAIASEDFLKLSARASDYVRAATQGVSDRVEGWQLEAVKKASCAIADVLLDEEAMTAAAFSGVQPVSSESVGGWSRSLQAPSLSAAGLEYLNNRKREALRMYLGSLRAFAPLFQVRSYPCQH